MASGAALRKPVKVLLVSANTERITMPTLPLGLGLVTAAARKAGYEVGLLDLGSEPDSQSALRGAVEQGSPDVIGISVRNVDNTFNLPPSYALELCRWISALRLDIVWRCILYPHNVPEDLMAAMAGAGCAEVSLGFESGCTRILRMMNKRFEPDEVRSISEGLAAHGIRRQGFLLLGGPGETRESVEESLAFADSLNLEMLKITVGIRIYPRTPLASTALREGLIGPEDDLLFPRFYLVPVLAGWLPARVKAWREQRGRHAG